MIKTARIIITYDCPRNCVGCCNKQAAFSKVSKFGDLRHLKEYDQVIFTGGEPLLDVERLLDLIVEAKEVNPFIKVVVYTALYKDNIADLITVMYLTDGMTITLHEQEDVEDFKKFNEFLSASNMPTRSLRLNVFKPINLDGLDLHLWKVKDNIEWIEDCPLPENETLFKL